MLIPVTFSPTGISSRPGSVEELTFASLQLREDQLEEFVRRHIDVIFDEDESLLVVGKQVFNSNGKRCDLVAVAEDGSLVLIELKRDAQDARTRTEPFESQAIRYAASLATIESETQLVERVFAPYIERHKDEFPLGGLTPSEFAHRQLREFLAGNQSARTFNKTQRIVLIASGFDEETLSASAWLRKQGIDITCVRLFPMAVDGNQFLGRETVVPPPELEELFVPFAEATSAPGVARGIAGTEVAAGPRRRMFLPRMTKLLEWGLIEAGDTLGFKGKDSGADAIVIDAKQVRYNGQPMGYNDWGKLVSGWSSVCIYEWATKDGRTLYDLRAERMEQEEQIRAAAALHADTTAADGVAADGTA